VREARVPGERVPEELAEQVPGAPAPGSVAHK
jgi:hypothetical protein